MSTHRASPSRHPQSRLPCSNDFALCTGTPDMPNLDFTIIHEIQPQVRRIHDHV